VRPARRVRIELAYDGTDFAGFQLQSSGRTVQGVLEDALTRIQGSGRVRVRGAGRTDAGAHARAQIADCELASRLDDATLLHALRAILPADLRPVQLATVAPEFDSRREARGKTYRYRLDLCAHASPFLARFALHHPHPVDHERVRTALAALPGERDWSAFTASSCKIQNRVRELTEATYEETGEEGWFSFKGSGFMTHMVRNMVGTLLEVSRGRTPADRVAQIVASRDRRLAGPTAPARGLVLWEVRYASADRGEAV
jgi:tRNA pseudouridine38-40 synthase